MRSSIYSLRAWGAPRFGANGIGLTQQGRESMRASRTPQVQRRLTVSVNQVWVSGERAGLGAILNPTPDLMPLMVSSLCPSLNSQMGLLKHKSLFCTESCNVSQ